MFERYTEKSRRVIFFARYEASQFGSPYIETEHLLLGLVREDKALANQFLRSHSVVDSIRTEVEKHTTIRERVSSSVDLPLSRESKHVLAFAAEESEQNGQKHIGSIHLLAGLLREEKSYAAEILLARGVQLSAVRAELKRDPAPDGAAGTKGLLSGWSGVAEGQSIRFEMLAEVRRQAHDRGIEMQTYLNSLLEKALHLPPVPPARGSLKETYNQLRSRIEAAGFPCLDSAQLEDEIARRKGVSRNI
jgi:ATP-dependent Clp protease ATP-binding subunit ClpC